MGHLESSITLVLDPQRIFFFAMLRPFFCSHDPPIHGEDIMNNFPQSLCKVSCLIDVKWSFLRTQILPSA